MSASPHTSSEPAADASYYRRVLHELIDLGADLARRVHAQAQGDPASDLTVAFDRIARTVRRTIVLARHLDTPVAARADRAHHRAAARRRILREVEDAIHRAPEHDPDELHAELLDRLDGPELDDEIDLRPTADIIADLCRDLGLSAPPGAQPWKRRTPEDIAVLCARAALMPAGHPAEDADDPDRRVRLVAAATGP